MALYDECPSHTWSCRALNPERAKADNSTANNPMADTCVSWRQTANCDSSGEREPQHDLACNAVVSGDDSGYCECEGGRKANEVGCGHDQFTCEEACAPPPPSCVSWRQTANCDSSGEREPQHDLACNAVVSGDDSGYCECEGGRKANEVGCGHDQFTCEEACAPPAPPAPQPGSSKWLDFTTLAKDYDSTTSDLPSCWYPSRSPLALVLAAHAIANVSEIIIPEAESFLAEQCKQCVATIRTLSSHFCTNPLCINPSCTGPPSSPGGPDLGGPNHKNESRIPTFGTNCSLVPTAVRHYCTPTPSARTALLISLDSGLRQALARARAMASVHLVIFTRRRRARQPLSPSCSNGTACVLARPGWMPSSAPTTPRLSGATWYKDGSTAAEAAQRIRI